MRRRPPLSSILGAIREDARRDRITLAGLAPDERVLAGAAIGVSLVGCLVILASTLGLDVPGGSVGVVGRFADAEQRTPLEVPIAVFVLAAVGLAVGAATLAAASVRSGGKAVGLLVFGIGIAIAGLGGLALGSLDALRVSARAIMGDEGLIVPAWHLTGLISLASAVAIVLLLVARPRGRRVLLPVAAAAPFLALLVSLLLAIGHEIPVGTFNQALAPDYPATLSIGAPIHGPILFFVGLTGGLIGLLAIWQTSTWTRASARQVGRHLGRQTRRWWWLLGGLLGAKLVWLALGIGGLLPPMLGGASGAWAALRSDDVASFLYVAVLVGVAGLWLLRPRRSLPESRALRWAGVVIALIAAVTLITTAVPLLVPALESLEPSGRTTSIPGDVTLGACLSTWSRPAGTLLSCLGLWLPDWQNLWILAVLLVAFVAGLALIRRRPTDGSAIFLVVLGAWGLPRGLQAASAVPPPELPGVADLPSFNAPQPETLDLAVTVLVLGLAIGWWMDRQRRVEPADLVIILVVSTLVIHGSTLVPTSPLPLLLAAAIIFPILYELVFDSKELNDPSREDRAARVLASTGSRALALTLLAVTLASGVVDIDSLTGRFAFIVFGLPFAITIVAVTISDRHALGARRGRIRDRRAWRSGPADRRVGRRRGARPAAERGRRGRHAGDALALSDPGGSAGRARGEDRAGGRTRDGAPRDHGRSHAPLGRARPPLSTGGGLVAEPRSAPLRRDRVDRLARLRRGPAGVRPGPRGRRERPERCSPRGSPGVLAARRRGRTDARAAR